MKNKTYVAKIEMRNVVVFEYFFPHKTYWVVCFGIFFVLSWCRHYLIIFTEIHVPCLLKWAVHQVGVRPCYVGNTIVNTICIDLHVHVVDIHVYMYTT